MKKFLFFSLILINFLYAFGEETWGINRLQKGTTYHFRVSSVSGLKIFMNGYQIQDQSLMMSKVTEAMEAAIDSWVAAATPMVTMVSGSGENQFQISTADLGPNGGEFDLNDNTMFLSTGAEYTVDYSDYSRIYLNTTVLHEMGHAFLGGGHCTNESSIMYTPGSPLRPIGWRGGLSGWDYTNVQNVYNPVCPITFKNSFGGGSLIVDGSNQSIPSEGFQPSWKLSQFPKFAQAIDDQQNSGYTMKFDYWTIPGNTISNLFISIQAVEGTYEAKFITEYDVTVENDFGGGQIIVTQNTVSSPSLHNKVREQASINVSAISPQCMDGFQYSFVDWQKNGITISTSLSTTSIPSGNDTYTARFSSTPLPPTEIFTIANVGQHIVIQWTPYQSSNLAYEIYRSRKNEAYQCVYFASPNSSSWTDPDCIVTGTSSDETVFYKLRTYYLPTGATSTFALSVTCGTVTPPEPRIMPGQLVNGKLDQLPTEFSIGNYPNPFNPSTTLSYQLPQNAFVTLEVYDMMGRKVTSLVQAQKSAGYHSVVWNAKDANGRNISSGTYIYRFVAQPLNREKSFISGGKMVLMR